MPRRCYLVAGFLVAACCLAANAIAAQLSEVAVQSPNGKIRLVLQIVEDGKKVLFSVERNGRPVIESSSLDVRLAEIGSVAAGASITGSHRWLVDESSDLPWGKTRRIRDHCGAATVRLKGTSRIVWDIELRAYDDGVAFRYLLPKQQDRVRDFVIEDENIEFRLAGDPTMLFTICDSFTTSHEALYERKPLSELPAKKLFDKPLLAVWPDGTAAALTEARLRNFAGMYLAFEPSPGGRGSTLRTRLSPLPDRSDALVVAKTPHWSPWRVVLLGDHAGKLIESNLLLCLNDAADGDYSWVKPGKTTFHWWNGMVEHGPPSTPEVNFAIHKKYIDFCARNKIAYHSVISVAGDRPWFVQRDPGFQDAPHPDTDILTPRPDIDLPRILEYAKEKGVGIRFWVHWKPLSEHLEEAFEQYERWGIRGLMVDFMDRDDQEMVEWQERCLRAAARHKLHIQFHGSYKPTGEQRTFPNLFNREGVLNLEYLKWSDSCTPAHSVNVAYTRQLAGPVDFHLGGFRAAHRDEFQPRDLNPVVMGTRCNQLALYVVFENPMPMVADDPAAYEGQPGFDFVVDVPTTWDETRFVAGDAGEYIVVARRSGNSWYLGGITNWTSRELSLPLDFLGPGQFEASLYLDRSLDGTNPNELRQEKREVSAATTLDVSLAFGGGVAAVLRPK
ncbi:MAG: glycoside hydrolase family 97 protein [Pirellulales bacterium]